MEKIIGPLTSYIMKSYWLLKILAFVLPVAVYFEAGPVSALITLFAYHLVIGLALHAKQAHDLNEATMEILGPKIEEMIKNGETSGVFKVDEFNTEEKTKKETQH